jgi:uncharacterized protein (TIGR02145 family)
MKKILFLVFCSISCFNLSAQFHCGDSLLDIRDGRIYATVQIGTQCWMAQNINYGTMIIGKDQTNNDIPEKFCYGNDTINCLTYGGLYQWGEMMYYSQIPGSKGICPEGWHIPTNEEYNILVSNYPVSPGTALAPGGTSGFNLQYGGFCGSNLSFGSLNIYCNLRTSTPSTMSGYSSIRYTYPSDTGFYHSTYPNLSSYSVRCIKDTEDVSIKTIMIKPSLYISDACPNPASDYFTVFYTLFQTQTAELVVYNVFSKECFRIKINNQSDNIKIYTDALQNGIYFYKIFTSSDCSLTKKVVIVK